MQLQSEYIKGLSWRYATKKFDDTKKVSNNDLEIIKKAIQLTPTSVGLQAFNVKIVDDQNIKKKLYHATYMQKQVLEASHIIILCPYSGINKNDIDEMIKDKAKLEDVTIESLNDYKKSIYQFISTIEKDKFIEWTSKQTYIVLGTILSICSLLKIDSCPMEGFDNHVVNKILGIEKLGLDTSCLIPIGYRSEKDTFQFKRKYRKSLNKLFI